ncbi:hypothetical protein Cni_G20026 [Canna indica]|uniref:Uncharacterized protein n=1 Tax=Canna indica TaxID=4628 RepID=A0AAQ3QHF6_9LILI|nr:hypothetical protein Cni_G20026 [Canna indica]
MGRWEGEADSLYIPNVGEAETPEREEQRADLLVEDEKRWREKSSASTSRLKMGRGGERSGRAPCSAPTRRRRLGGGFGTVKAGDWSGSGVRENERGGCDL